MGKLTTFDIVLNGDSPVGFAGHWMYGKVIVELSDAMSMHGLYLQFCGKSLVHFKVGKRTCQSNEVYMNSLVVLKGHGPQESAENVTLAAGRYEFPFSFQLPETLPSSYEDITGQVRYNLKAIIEKPWKFDHKTKMMFTVVGICDLNMLPDARVPQVSMNEKSMGNLCCKYGTLSAWLQSNKKGYLPGEKIILSGEIKNSSSQDIDSSVISMQAKTVFYAGGTERPDFRKICEVKRGSIQHGGLDSFDNLALRIPPIPASYLQGCKIIDIRYFIRLVVKLGFASDLVVAHEIIVGNVPLRNEHQPHPPRARLEAPSAPPGSGISAAQVENVMADFSEMNVGGRRGNGPSIWQEFPTPPMERRDHGSSVPSNMAADGALPSYQECVWGRTDTREEGDNEHTHGNHHWAPSYPFYGVV